MESGSIIKNFVVENFLFGEANSLDENTDFFEKGIIDSTGIIELVCFVEESFDIAVKDEELIPENFSTIKKLDQFINHKKQKQAVKVS